ncbi:protein CcmA, bactofilin family [Hydrobacter penzbergensis]|uniref:Protein CcmA, bactofilin family n=2 Tax=Hydrobacter penzbergensis TaxID=1235997 RepID=A0A8X8LFC7_9BACT|nr:cytoskeletal protein CcmA (bactofilin family) [Sediminibacterium magnilacihabitans]SDX04023.1 protein CcmA, bactofilin family [Hydrobacter penzbergensis]
MYLDCPPGNKSHRFYPMLFQKKTNTTDILPAVQVVSGGVYFGIIKTLSPIRIEGDFKGIIFCTNKVIIDKKATVSGDILCHEIVIGGLIDGNVVCKSKCLLHADAMVNGVIRTAQFENGENSSVSGPVYVSKDNTSIDVDEYYELFNKKENLEKIKEEYFSLPQKLILIS